MTILISVLVGILFFGQMLLGKVPIPFDALAGVYHPFNQIDWGYAAGIPYKNMAVTDVFSQLYPWRELAVNIMRNGQWPLWNQYSFAGYPLLANWQSAPFQPLNILMVLFGNVWGYGLMIVVGSILAVLGMYFFLREKRLGTLPALTGSIVFGFAGFMTTYLAYATTCLIFACLPWLWLFIDKFLNTRRVKFALFFGLLHTWALVGGFFQPVLYVLILAWGYLLSRSLGRIRQTTWLWIFALLGIAMASAQILPVAEYLTRTIRNVDANIYEYHFGLLPIKNLITLVAPDFFGNPATNNFFGYMQYQETAGYFSVIGVLLIASLIWTSNNKGFGFFWFMMASSLLLAFDNPISKLIYDLQIPLISTGYASRWLMVTGAVAAVLVAVGMEYLNKKRLVILSAVMITMLTVLMVTTNNKISVRNLILPTALLVASFLIGFVRGKQIPVLLLCFLIIFDMRRYMVKFTPFSMPEYREKQSQFLEKVRNEVKDKRVLIENGPLLPANTWIYYRLRSISGYDPLLPKDYATWFRALNIGVNKNQPIDGSLADGKFTRYLNLDNPLSPLLDLTGGQYLIALKRDKIAQIDDDGLINPSYKKNYETVFEEGPTVLLKKKRTIDRYRFYYNADFEPMKTKSIEKLLAGYDFENRLLVDDNSVVEYSKDKSDKIVSVEERDNQINFETETSGGAYLFLADSFDENWRAKVNNKESRIYRAFGVFKAVKVPPGNARVVFDYKPKSFEYGLGVSLLSALVTLSVSVLVFKKL